MSAGEKSLAAPQRETAAPGRSPHCGEPVPRAAAPNAFFGLQRSAGNCAVARLFASGAIQASLRISQPGDTDEIEADRVAERVVSSKDPPAIQRNARPSSSSGQNVPSDFLHELGSGQPLDGGTRGFMESRFGRDFSGVRVHTGDQAAESAQSIQARAFAAGSHVVFDKGEYHPHTSSGRKLLAHELTHVVQQSQTGPGNQVVHRAPPPQQKLPEGITTDTYTLLKTRKLHADGIFTSQVLSFISTTWTRLSAYGGPEVAQRAVDLLEASDTFVHVANALDTFYTKKGNPRIRLVLGFLGSKFVPAGMPWQDRTDQPVEVVPDEDTILLDFTNAIINLWGPKPEQIVEFASTIIHESSHAYHKIMGLTRGGLQGELEEEQSTRKDELAGLQEIRSGSITKEETAALDKRIGEIQQGPLTNRAIAEDFVSGGEGTYLESFFIDSAIHQLTERMDTLGAKLRKAKSPIPDTLTPITQVTPQDLLNYDFSAFVTTQFYSMTPHLPKWAVQKGHTPSKGEIAFLDKFSKMKLTLKQIVAFRPPALSEDYRYVFFYLALIKAYGVKEQVRQAWQDFQDDSDPDKKKSDVMEKNARDLLGEAHPYSTIKK
jgi:hypothetical protein